MKSVRLPFCFLFFLFLPSLSEELVFPQLGYPPLLENVKIEKEGGSYVVVVEAKADQERDGAPVAFGEVFYWQEGGEIFQARLSERGEDEYGGVLENLKKGKLDLYLRLVDTEGNVTMTLPLFVASSDKKKAEEIPFIEVLHDEKGGTEAPFDILKVSGAADAENFYVRWEMRGAVFKKEEATKIHPFYAISFATAADEFVWDTGIGRYLIAYIPNLGGLTPFGNVAGDAFILERDVKQRVFTPGTRYLPIASEVKENLLTLTFPRFFASEPAEKGWMATFITGLADDFITWEIPLEVPKAIRDITPFLRLYIQNYTFEIEEEF